MTSHESPRSIEPRLLITAVLIGLAISAWHPKDLTTWLLEVAPILIGLPLVIALSRRFPLTRLVQRLLLLHALILMVGGHYTYAQVPLGEWAKDWFGFTRNHYDRLGHLAQGFVPALIAREALLRRTTLGRGGWLFFIVTSICLAISAGYELIEWCSALIFGGKADAFLGTQGDVWDTQSDMFCALIGALAAQLLLARRHDRELEQFQK